jgi:hypothetical protein
MRGLAWSVGETVGMSGDDTTPAPDPIDVEMAHIDARDPDVAEEIEEVEADAEALGREADQPLAPSEERSREY